MSWWTLMDNLQRLTFLPHLLAGQALLLFLLIAGSDEKTLVPTGNWLFLGIMAVILGMIFPPGLVFVGAAYGVMVVLSFVFSGGRFKKKDTRNEWITTNVLSRAMIGLISFPSLLYFSLMFGLYPWKRLVELDIIHPLPFQFPEYILALGPTLPLGLIGLFLVLFRKDRKFMGVVSWVIAWLVCLFVFQYIPQQSPLRFSEMLPHVPLGILTAYVFYTMSKIKIQKSPLRQGFEGQAKLLVKIQKYVAICIPMILIVVGFGVMMSSFLWQKDFIDQKVAAGWPQIYMNNVIVYPITGFVDALVYLEKNTPKDAIVLSDMTAGNYIPPYTGRRVFVGHNNTVNLEEKLSGTQLFFRGEKKDAYTWLKNNGIGYIFFGPQERELGKLQELIATYPFLTELYKNNDVVLYRVQ